MPYYRQRRVVLLWAGSVIHAAGLLRAAAVADDPEARHSSASHTWSVPQEFTRRAESHLGKGHQRSGLLELSALAAAWPTDRSAARAITQIALANARGGGAAGAKAIAARRLAEHLSAGPASPDLLLAAAAEHCRLRLYTRALASLDRMAAAPPSARQLLQERFLRALVLDRAGHQEKARAILDHLAREDPGQLVPLNAERYLARLDVAAGRRDAALGHLSRAAQEAAYLAERALALVQAPPGEPGARAEENERLAAAIHLLRRQFPERVAKDALLNRCVAPGAKGPADDATHNAILAAAVQEPVARRLCQHAAFELARCLQRFQRFEVAKKQHAALLERWPQSELHVHAERTVVLFNGYYLLPPYELHTTANELQVNGQVVMHIGLPKLEPSNPPELIEIRPSMDGRITSKTELLSALTQRYYRWVPKHGKAETRRKLLALALEQPMVASAKWEDDDNLILNDQKGHTTFIEVRDRPFALPSPAQTKMYLRREADMWRTRFKTAGVVLYAAGFTATVPSRRSPAWLHSVLGILNSPDTPDQKARTIADRLRLPAFAARMLALRLGPTQALMEVLLTRRE